MTASTFNKITNIAKVSLAGTNAARIVNIFCNKNDVKYITMLCITDGMKVTAVSSGVETHLRAE